MAVFRIEIETNNAAFAEDRAEEISRILKQTINKVKHGSSGAIMDINGNRVGYWGFYKGNIS